MKDQKVMFGTARAREEDREKGRLDEKTNLWMIVSEMKENSLRFLHFSPFHLYFAVILSLSFSRTVSGM